MSNFANAFTLAYSVRCWRVHDHFFFYRNALRLLCSMLGHHAINQLGSCMNFDYFGRVILVSNPILTML